MSIFKTTTLAAAAALACTAALAQPTQPTQTITITGSSAGNSASVAGFGDVPLARSPFSATVIGTAQLQDAGISSLADITRLDAGITDAYNAPGYWGQVAVRGFTLDNRFNFRRDGLPVNAETVLPTGNKSGLELLKGADDAVLGVLAHEHGHVKRQHGLHAVVRFGLVSAATSVALGDFSAVLAGVPALLAHMGYSRDAEREADAWGARAAEVLD